MAKTSHPVPKVGDTVHLNDEGLETIYGSKTGVTHMKTLNMKVTWVATRSLTAPEETFSLRVDNPDINKFMLDNWMFSIVPS